MYFGTQYFRPPFPNKQYWETDLDNIKKLNFNNIKVWAVWNWIERTPGQFQFDELDELVELCAQRGISVTINTIPEGAPYWTSTGYEDAFYQMSTGEVLKYSGPGNIPSAGWPGLCPDSEQASELICNFIYETAKHFADHPAVDGIDVWNEPHLEPMFDYPDSLLCYCDHTQERFRKWLQERYGTLEKLNKTWFRAYTDWKQIEAPRRYGTAADMIDWRRFGMYNLARVLRERVAAARRGAPNKIIQTHVPYSGYMGQRNDGGLAQDLTEEFLLAKEVDQFGLSSFPLWLMGEEYIGQHFMNLEIIAEASRGKPFYQVELQGGGGKEGMLGGRVPKWEDVLQWNLSVIAAGGKGAVYWQYRPESAGMESPGFGLVNIDGTLTERAHSAAACAKRFGGEQFDSLHRCLSDNAIFLSRNADLHTYAIGEEKKYNHSFKGYHQALTDLGIPCRFVHADYAEQMYAEGVRTLYVPQALALSQQECDDLLHYVMEGGMMVVEAGAGMYRENGQLDIPMSFLDTLFGMHSCSFDRISDAVLPAYHNGAKFFDCAYYRQYFEACASDCMVLATFEDGMPAALERKIGAGRVIWLGGFVGAAYWENRDAVTGQFIADFADPNGYLQIDFLTARNMTVRLLENEDQFALVCINRTADAVDGAVCIAGEHLHLHIPGNDGVVKMISKKR